MNVAILCVLRALLLQHLKQTSGLLKEKKFRESHAGLFLVCFWLLRSPGPCKRTAFMVSNEQFAIGIQRSFVDFDRR